MSYCMGYIYTKLQLLFIRNSNLIGCPVFHLATLLRLELMIESFIVIEKKNIIGQGAK